MIEAMKQALEAYTKEERHRTVAETRYWCAQYRLLAEQAIAAIAEAEKQEPVAWSPVLDYQNYKENRVWANGQPSQQDIDYWSKNGDGITYAYTSPPAAQQVVPKGWRMVPINPTPAMKQAGGVACTRGQDIAHHTWAQMLSAAPNTPAAQRQPVVPEGYALVDIQALKRWGVYDYVVQACQYPITAPFQRQPEQEGCACRWDHEDNRVVTCERHQGWLDVIAEWADRAREAEAKLRATPPAATAQRQPLTDEEIEKGRSQTFSVDNPYCPCDSKTMRKAVRWAEAKHGIGEKK